ncbi:MULTISPECIES: 3-hydroxyacyl-ACP dehydratase [Chryseobacterium]|jgi:3-hydroxyacyl-[acyl-carrier-protein] dehydratase|uniref:3-hydroxyacyl-[acyl-carrier-protein] dehydratase n=1 Tax=Chryseobacterium rhizosphaerae TaxID=395937 RepID=A0AAE3Y9E2_9FLAO|nr:MULTISPECIES: 3-hydroxyacyl-ACP dehydratase [Chryseobacterium]MBL3549377.1 3-hydroxyacyl-ACP dehydratase [Chryseobacterium sp. KMC2]MDC8102866.1 3-hydroxyacyl-ACP dehydratase [Chryseobacterium rhizosphaerae]MDR6526327.1 3-hydroxyacyl-[acyl-carrier-protein] dehydratase [Chryseobacterium rhizosphaerae]MDR6545896.1 3-hydroxyacyl-[acyl-carrier-protein] dehydratase [Chryseobacterium rhizosphaerae]SMC93660.1 3-hydroxyacyl-[acyl-carrier-protein] dehydratase [Chryseobacterium sp. YR221]
MQTILTDFYTLQSYEKTENGSFIADISLNKDHDIFKGHFPGNPVTPGVCMMQIVKELTEEFVGSKLFLKTASNVKFMAIINPFETPDLKLQLDIDENGEDVKVKNITSFGETIALKMSVSYKKLTS